MEPSANVHFSSCATVSSFNRIQWWQSVSVGGWGTCRVVAYPVLLTVQFSSKATVAPLTTSFSGVSLFLLVAGAPVAL